MMPTIVASRDREEGLVALRHACDRRVRIGGERLPADPLAAAPDAWLRSKKLAHGVPAHFAGDEVGADALVDIIDATAEAFLLQALSWSANSKDDPQSVPPARLLRVSARAGKSRRVIDAIADSAGLLRGRTVYYLAPSHALAAELRTTPAAGSAVGCRCSTSWAAPITTRSGRTMIRPPAARLRSS